MAFRRFNHLNVPEYWERYFTKYPQGMTILESLFEWVSQVDSMTDNVNKWNVYLDDFVVKFDSELQDTLFTTLKEWQQSGFLDDVITHALQTQIDVNKKQTTADLNELRLSVSGKVNRGENESITLPMLASDILEAIETGVWNVNINTSNIENGAVTISKLHVEESKKITKFETIGNISEKIGFVSKYGGVDPLDSFRYKEYTVKPSEQLKITARVSSTTGALAVFTDSANKLISSTLPQSETGTTEYTDKSVTVPVNATKLFVSRRASENEPIVKRIQYVDTNKLFDTVEQQKEDMIYNQYVNVTNEADYNEGTYIGKTGNVESIGYYQTYILDVTVNEKYAVSADITATSGALTVFKDLIGRVVGTYGSTGVNYKREIVTVPSNAVTMSVSTSTSKTVVIEKVTTKKIKDFVEPYANNVNDASENEDYTLKTLQERVTNYDNMFDFKWKPLDKGCITIIIDDGREDLYKFQQKMLLKGFPLSVAIITDRLQSILGNGQTLLELMTDIEKTGGEVLSHSISSSVFKADTDEAVAETRLRQSRETLNNLGFNAYGFVKPGGTGALGNLAQFEHLVKKYYKYGFSAGGNPPYVTGRSSIHDKELSTIKTIIDKCETDKTWVVWYAHTFDNEVNETLFDDMLTYIATKNVDVLTPKQMYEQSKSLVFK